MIGFETWLRILLQTNKLKRGIPKYDFANLYEMGREKKDREDREEKPSSKPRTAKYCYE